MFLLGAAAISLSVGCEVSGITREPSVALIENDLTVPVRLRLCSSNDCKSFHPPNEVLAPGEATGANVSSVGVPNVYLVSINGLRLGCLPLVSPDIRRTEIRVRVSEHVPCREDLNEDVFWPPRWEGVP